VRRFFVQAGIVAFKDLTLEARSRERITAMASFAVLVAVIFSFALEPSVRARSIAGAMLWVTILFAGILGLGRSFAAEREEEALTGLLLTPVSREAIYAGKLAANLALLLAVEVLIFPVYALFFSLPAPSSFAALGGVVVAGSTSFMALGTLFAAVTAHTRLGETLLPILLLPLLLPVVIFAAAATQRLIAGRPVAEVDGALRVLVAFALLYVFVGALTFGSVLEE
jgi:heme exporter protein B